MHSGRNFCGEVKLQRRRQKNGRVEFAFCREEILPVE